MTETNNFERDNPIQTFLPRPINDALATPTDLFKQFVIAEVCHYPLGARSHATARRWWRIDRSVNFLHERAKACLQKTSRTRSVLGHLGSALAAGCDYSCHSGSSDRALVRYCNKFRHRLLPQYGNKMPQLILNVARYRYGVGNLLPQQQLVTLAKPVKRLLHRILGHS